MPVLRLLQFFARPIATAPRSVSSFLRISNVSSIRNADHNCTITSNNKNRQAPRAFENMPVEIPICPWFSRSVFRSQFRVERLDEGMPLCKERYCYETKVSREPGRKPSRYAGSTYPTLCSSLRSLGSENCARRCGRIRSVSIAGHGLSMQAICKRLTSGFRLWVRRNRRVVMPRQ